MLSLLLQNGVVKVSLPSPVAGNAPHGLLSSRLWITELMVRPPVYGADVGRVGHRAQLGQAAVFSLPLVGNEPERLVLHDWAANEPPN